MVLCMPQELVLDLLCGYIVISPLHFMINGIQGRTYVVQQGIYLSRILAFCFTRCHAPIIRKDALLRTELA